MLSAKKRNLCEMDETDGGESRISNLGDALLVHILSFLPTKDGVRTSVLAKRWQYLWMSTWNLEFREAAPNKRMFFMNFVERVLLLRNPVAITKFSLACDVLSCDDSSRINAWISTALKNKVQVLDLCLDQEELVGEPLVLPRCLFTTCESLQVLKLDMVHLHLPQSCSICFPSLKILTLKNVIFPDYYSAEQLLSATYLVLEELNLIVCHWDNVKTACISGPRLKKLYIEETDPNQTCDSDYDDQSDDDDDTAEENNSKSCQFVIAGLNLEYFDYMGDFSNDYYFCSSPSIVKARINQTNFVDRSRSYRAFKLLSGLSNTKSLYWNGEFIAGLRCSSKLLAHLPLLYNMTHLETYWILLLHSRQDLLAVLEKSPRLKSLTLKGGFWEFTFDRNPERSPDWTLDPVPACFLTHLKTIEVTMFTGSVTALYAAKILLKSATVLEKMVIGFDPWKFRGRDGLKSQHEIRQRFLSFPKGSMSCVIATSCPSAASMQNP